MSFFTLASPYETHPPQIQGPAILVQDKFGNLIVCEPEPSSSTSASATVLPSANTITRIETPIDTSKLRKYTIYEGTDGNKYLSPSVISNELNPQSIQLITAPPQEALPEDESDDEPLPHQLDHMYAKKPKDPNAVEVKKPVKKRTRKKEAAKPQIIIEEVAPVVPEAPRINIIRQSHTLPTTSSVFSTRPRILNQRESSSWIKSEPGTNHVGYPNLTNSVAQSNTQVKRRPRKCPTSQRKLPKSDNGVVMEEHQLPQLGGVVTIVSANEDGSHTTLDPQYSDSNNTSYTFEHVSLDYLDDSYMEEGEADPLVTQESQVDESELFFQFPVDEVEEVVV